MYKIMLSTVTVLLLGGTTLSAEDVQVRLGVSASTGTATIENTSNNTTATFDLKDGSGFEVSLVTGVDKEDGFDFRPALTLQSNDVTIGAGLDTSDIMLLGEFEFAYNINEYISPFIGFYGGIGATDLPAINESGLLTYDLGLLIGISGEVYKDLGYYAKYSIGTKGYNFSDSSGGIRENLNSMKVGVSYTF